MSRRAGLPETRICTGSILVLFGILVCGRASAEETVTIVRDTWGIAHVFADSDQGAMFGAGYATAQDRMYQMHRNRRAVQGRLAELVGEMHKIKDGQIVETTITQDMKFRYRQLDRYAREVACLLDADTQAMLQAYCDGVNEYIATHGDDLLYLFGEEMPEPWEPWDCLGAWNRMADYFGPNGLDKAKTQHEFELLVLEHGLERAIEIFCPEKEIDDDAAVVKLEDVPPETYQAIMQYAEDHGFGGEDGRETCGRLMFTEYPIPKFSHAWVVGADKTTTGVPVLHSDPQTAVASPALWYEIHVKGATFDARGIGVAGCPGFLIGWSGHDGNVVAWGATALGADMADLFELEMIDDDTFKYDRGYYDFEAWDEYIYVKGGDPVRITLEDTFLGPVVTTVCPEAYRSEEFIWKALPTCDCDRHTVQATLAMMRAGNIGDFQAALALWRHPGVHMVFSDNNDPADGSIGYWVLGAIPVRSTLSPVGGMIAQDGSLSDYYWQDTLPPNIRPHVIDPAEGSIWSANHLPVGSWYPIPLSIGQGGTGDSVRSWRLAERLKGVASFAPSDVLAVHFDDVNPAIRTIFQAGYHIRDNLHGELPVRAELALGLLQGWYSRGAHSDTAEQYYAAAYHVDLNFRENDAPELMEIYGGGQGGLCYFLKSLEERLVDPAAPMDAYEIGFIGAALADGWLAASANYGADPESWQGNFANGPGSEPIRYFRTLEGFGSLDANEDGLTTVDGNTILSQKGQSYSQWVNLGDVDGSLALLPVGVAENPESPFFMDQGALWVGMTLRAAPLDRTIIENMPPTSTLELTYSP